MPVSIYQQGRLLAVIVLMICLLGVVAALRARLGSGVAKSSTSNWLIGSISMLSGESVTSDP